MDTPHAGGLDEDDERALVQRSLDRALRELTGQPVRGWLSPGKLNSPNTPTCWPRPASSTSATG